MKETVLMLIMIASSLAFVAFDSIEIAYFILLFYILTNSIWYLYDIFNKNR